MHVERNLFDYVRIWVFGFFVIHILIANVILLEVRRSEVTNMGLGILMGKRWGTRWGRKVKSQIRSWIFKIC